MKSFPRKMARPSAAYIPGGRQSLTYADVKYVPFEAVGNVLPKCLLEITTSHCASTIEKGLA